MEYLQKTYLPVWQTVQTTELTAENCLHAWQTLQMTGVTAERRLLPWKTLLITEVTAEDRLPAWQTLKMTILPLYFLSSFHMWLSNTLLVCSRISQKSAQLWQNNIKQWSSSTQLIQRHVSHLHWTHWKQKRPRHITLKIQDLAWNRHLMWRGFTR
jgi:hypothetical protein